jgi:hypothetical protein
MFNFDVIQAEDMELVLLLPRTLHNGLVSNPAEQVGYIPVGFFTPLVHPPFQLLDGARLLMEWSAGCRQAQEATNWDEP